jgi:ABC-type transport system involved in cytochrome c biogenesis permease component
MLCALFLREFRKSWLAHAGLFAAAFGTATLLEYAISGGGRPQLESELALSRLLLAGLALSGLVSGERCFSVAFKEGRYSFLLTLPEPRSLIWFAYLGGRLIGALAAMPIILLVRSSLLLRGLSSPESSFEKSILIAALAVYIVYFLGGVVLALAVHKEVLVYLIGLPIFSALLGLLALSASYGFDDISFLESSRFLYESSLGSLVLALVTAALAKRAFCRGELHLRRRAAQTLAECGLASAAFAAMTLIIFSSFTLSALRDEWQPVPRGNKPGSDYLAYESPVSTGGRFLFIRQQLRERSRFTRLAVVDLESGLVSNWMERPDFRV